MTIPRIYQSVELSVGMELCLDHAASHHVMRVLRVRLNEELILFNGQRINGHPVEYIATIIGFDRQRTRVYLKESKTFRTGRSCAIHLAQALLSSEKMDYLIQKSVELGVTAITPLITARCNITRDPSRHLKRHARWQSIIIGACEQSGRTELAQISLPQHFDLWIQTQHTLPLSPKRYYVLLTTGHAHATQYMPRIIPKDACIILIIGPEGGFSKQEEEKAYTEGFYALHLGPRILRAETAALAALSIMQYRYGDMDFLEPSTL